MQYFAAFGGEEELRKTFGGTEGNGGGGRLRQNLSLLRKQKTFGRTEGNGGWRKGFGGLEGGFGVLEGGFGGTEAY